MSGDQVQFSVNGAGCGIYAQGFAQGAANGSFSGASGASGSLTINFQNPKLGAEWVSSSWTAVRSECPLDMRD
jgi:hypothetical protein